MKWRLHILYWLLSPALLLRSADDSPAFFVQNDPAPANPSAKAAEPSAAREEVTATLADGSTFSAWLDGAALHVRFNHAPDTVIDPHASRACPPAITTFPDGTALLVWRGHGEDGSRDLRYSRFQDGAWQASAVLSPDDWSTPAEPVGQGPAMVSRGAHVAVAWFTAGGGPRINVTTSASAGIQWLMPQRIDDVAPVGRVSVVLLDDGAQLVSWVERVADEHVILLRRISSRGTLSVPVRLARLSSDPGHPRLTRIKDGDATPAQLHLAYTENSVAVARLITLPDAKLLAEADACDCDPRPEELRGYSLQGRVTALDPKAGTITLAHGDIPGIMKATTTVFNAAPDLIAAAPFGRRIVARAERIGPDWWLFGVRTLPAPR